MEVDSRATQAACDFGYNVSFTGVGTPKNALRGCAGLLHQFPHFLTAGYCSQVAVFRRALTQPEQILTPEWGGLEIIFHRLYERNVFTPYPPDPESIATPFGAVWRQFRPEFSSQYPAGFKPSFSGSTFGGVYTETDEDSVVCQIRIEKLWDVIYTLGKLCRFNKTMFMKVGENLEGMAFDRGIVVSGHGLMKEFVGIEGSGGSLRSFWFARRDSEMCVFYEFWKDPPKIFQTRDEGFSTRNLGREFGRVGSR